MGEDIDPRWYRKIWTLDVQDMSWVEDTVREVDFAVEVLQLAGTERVLDLACGFGRHSLELARRGFPVVGVDITEAYIEAARGQAAQEYLPAEFVCADLRDVSFGQEFDVVLNLADGAVGYLENDEENLRVFDLVAAALKPGGKHLLGVCNGDYARKHFPRRHWEMGTRSLSLADFAWDEETSRMIYRGRSFRFGETFVKPETDPTPSWIRLYTLDELRYVLGERRLDVRQAFGGYDTAVPATVDALQLVVYSGKSER